MGENTDGKRLTERSVMVHMEKTLLNVCADSQASGNFIESFTSRLLRDSAGSPVSNEEEDIVKWCAAGLYAGAADTVSALCVLVRR